MQEDNNASGADVGRERGRAVPPQIVRIIALTALIVVAYFVARHFLVPASFHQYGWYRGDALKENAAKPISFAGRAACAECHTDVAEALDKSPHRSISCESCHDANHAHAEDPTAVTPAKIANPKFCLRCHEYSLSRPAKFPQVESASHNSDQACMECHSPHAPTEAPSK